ncbi:MAG: hypothetical protein JNJ46_09265 [Myxococcales bacterium]|nr:hypothetical protein [Myxococcales bacterium]
MASWSEVQAFVRKHYVLRLDQPHHFTMDFALPEAEADVDAGKARPALDEASLAAAVVHVHGQLLQASDGAKTWLSVRAEVCGERAMSPTAALRHGARLLLGALVLSGNQYVLRHTLLLSDLSLSSLQYALEYIAREAGALRKKVLKQTASPPRSPLGQSLND